MFMENSSCSYEIRVFLGKQLPYSTLLGSDKEIQGLRDSEI
jgi:hypothetical protein